MPVSNHNTKLKYEATPSSGTYTDIPGGPVTNIPSLSISSDSVEITSYASEDGFKEFSVTLHDTSEVTVEQILDLSTDVFRTLQTSRALRKYRIEYTNLGYKVDFSAYVTSFEINSDIAEVARVTVTLRPTGKATFSTIS